MWIITVAKETAMDEEQKQTFQSRLAKIDVQAQKQAAKAPKRKKDSFLRRLAYPGAFVGAFFLGGLTVFVSRYAQYHLVGIPGAAGQGNQDIISLIFAGMIILTMSVILKAKAKEVATASTIGVLIGVFIYHNLVWEFPDFFATVYGPDWVDALMKQTEPSSLFVFGTTLTLG